MKLTISTISTLIFVIFIFGACNEGESPATTDTSPLVIEIEAQYNAANNEHLFVTDTDTIPSGWTTVRLRNTSPFVHFAFFERLPGDRTADDMHAEILSKFQEASYLIEDGNTEEAMAKFGEMPEWFSEIVWMGGTGFVSPGLETETTLYLDPGNYQVECYIKTADGTYHWNMGMYFDLHVTDDTTDAQPPQDVDVTITTTDNGLMVEGEPKVGENLVAVNFSEDNPGLLGRDVHVVEVTEDTDPEELKNWMNFNLPGSLASTVDDPGPAVFVGGTHDMPKGYTAYFTFTMEEGKDYAWITEQAADRYEFIRMDADN